ncbi:MAG: T9SS type A sorting domain-containing protein [Bacillota bacterium]
MNGYELRQNYPNPFNPVTYISFSIPESKFVRLKVYDILGREVSVLLNKQLEAGEHKIRFEDHFLPGGIYIYSLQAGQFRDSKKLLLLK